MILEIYQLGKLPPLTVVECDDWVEEYGDTPRLLCYNNKKIVAIFNLNNIAGFKTVDEDCEVRVNVKLEGEDK